MRGVKPAEKSIWLRTYFSVIIFMQWVALFEDMDSSV